MKRRTPCPVLFAAIVCSSASAETVILNPIADASLFEGPDSGASNGAGTGIFAGVNRGGERRRALLQFDLSSIPVSATINSVALTLTVTRQIAGAPDITLHRLTNSWGEGTTDAGEPGGQGAPAAPDDATWFFRFFGSLPWANPGGDFLAAPSASQNVFALGSYTWSGPGLIDDVSAWLDGTAPNHGWLLRGDETAGFNAKRFASRESADPAARPTLVVEFTPRLPCQGDYDQNGVINFGDITFILANWGEPFTFNDITVVLANWSSAC